MDTALAAKLFAALFAIMNPLTNLPIFLSLTTDRTPKQSQMIAATCAGATFAILLVVLLAGDHILGFFGVTVNDFRISGGILILMIALAMLHVQPSRMHHTSEEAGEGQENENPGLFPLAMPLLAGPGSMTTVIVFSHKAHGVEDMTLCAAVILSVSALIYVTFALGGRIGSWLGTTGLNIVTRIMGMLLAAIAVGMIVEGLLNSFPGLRG